MQSSPTRTIYGIRAKQTKLKAKLLQIVNLIGALHGFHKLNYTIPMRHSLDFNCQANPASKPRRNF